jgi:hypothetical protein
MRGSHGSKSALPRAALATLLLSVAAARAGEPAASAEDVRPPAVGGSLPELTLTTAEGEPFDLNAAVAEQPTVLILYRGGW